MITMGIKFFELENYGIGVLSLALALHSNNIEVIIFQNDVSHSMAFIY